MDQTPTKGTAGIWLMVAGAVLLAIGIVELVLPGPAMTFITPGLALLVVGLVVRVTSAGRTADPEPREP